MSADPAGAGHNAPATMSDVARLAAVSPQTVSRVLNDHRYVTDETRRKVMDAVVKLGYRRNSSARALVTRQTMSLGLVTTGQTQWGPSVALFGIADAARQAGYSTSVMSLGESITREAMQRAFDGLAVDGVDGIIVIAPVHDAVAAAERASVGMPVVLFEPGADNGTTIVAVDEVLGARAATRHLLELGHRTVWHIAGPEGWLGTQARIRGWQAELAAAGAVTHEVIAGDWSSASGYAAGLELARIPEVTAAFVANDQMALGVLKALRECGREVPGDISIVGFDDVPEAAFFEPALTTVHLDFDAVGRRCVAHLLSMIRGEALEPEPAASPPLVVRATTAAPRPRRRARNTDQRPGGRR